jgi:hypothetical protein
MGSGSHLSSRTYAGHLASALGAITVEVTLRIASHPLRFVFSVLSPLCLNNRRPFMFRPKHLIRVAGAICLAILLSGCVVEPAWGPYYGHPHHWGY